MSHTFFYSSVTGLLLLALSGCGGPLAYTAEAYDASKVSAEQRQAIEAAESEAADAGRRSREAEEKVPAHEEALEDAEAAAERAEYEVDLARPR